MPKLQWMLLAVCLWGAANAKPVVQPDGVAGLYFKDDAGGLNLGCSISKVSSPKFEAVLNRKDALLSAGHCVPEIPGYIPSFAYVTWDDGLSFARVKPVLLGDGEQGYDLSLWLPADNKAYVLYNAANSYPLSEREGVDWGENISSWGHPLGLGLTYTQGQVAQPVVERPLLELGGEDGSINWIGAIAANLNCTGGCSGSSVFDEKGQVVGVISGRVMDFTGFALTYIVPTQRIYHMLEDDSYTLDLQEKKEKSTEDTNNTSTSGRTPKK